MFNKTKIGVGTALVLGSFAAHAAVDTQFTSTPAGAEVVYSAEGANGVLTTAIDSFEITLDKTYIDTDVITLDFSADLVDGQVIDGAPIDCTGPDTPADTIQLSYAGAGDDDSQLKYRFVNLADGAADGVDTVGAVCAFTKSVQLYVLDGTSATVSWSSELEAGPALTLASTVGSEFSAAAGTLFNAVIDVTSDRLQFTPNVANDEATITVTQSTTVDTKSVTDGSIWGDTSTVTLNGDFSFMDDPATEAFDLLAGYDVTVTATTGGALSTGDVDVTASGVSFPVTAANFTAGAAEFTLAVAIPSVVADRTQEILTNTFSADVAVVYTNAVLTGVAPIASGSAALNVASLGAFTLNATEVTVYSVPFSAGVIQMLWVTNGSLIDGDVSATITHEGATTAAYELGQVDAKSNLSIGSLLSTAAGADYPTSGRGDVTVTVTSSDTKVLGSYYKDGDRLLLESSDTLNSDIPE
jgi:hypothetical protein